MNSINLFIGDLEIEVYFEIEYWRGDYNEDLFQIHFADAFRVDGGELSPSERQEVKAALNSDAVFRRIISDCEKLADF